MMTIMTMTRLTSTYYLNALAKDLHILPCRLHSSLARTFLLSDTARHNEAHISPCKNYGCEYVQSYACVKCTYVHESTSCDRSRLESSAAQKLASFHTGSGAGNEILPRRVEAQYYLYVLAPCEQCFLQEIVLFSIFPYPCPPAPWHYKVCIL